MPARAEAAARRPVVFKNSRRVVEFAGSLDLSLRSFMVVALTIAMFERFKTMLSAAIIAARTIQALNFPCTSRGVDYDGKNVGDLRSTAGGDDSSFGIVEVARRAVCFRVAGKSCRAWPASSAVTAGCRSGPLAGFAPHRACARDCADPRSEDRSGEGRGLRRIAVARNGVCQVSEFGGVAEECGFRR